MDALGAFLKQASLETRANIPALRRKLSNPHYDGKRHDLSHESSDSKVEECSFKIRSTSAVRRRRQGEISIEVSKEEREVSSYEPPIMLQANYTNELDDDKPKAAKLKETYINWREKKSKNTEKEQEFVANSTFSKLRSIE